MFKFLFLLLFSLTVTGTSFAGDLYRFGLFQDDKINQKDGSGKKQGKWVYYGKDRPQEGYPMEGKIEEGPYKDDRKDGVWIKYHNDGITPKLKGVYSNNRPKGSYTKYHANGKIRETGSFEKNQYQDSLKRFHQNGQLEYEAKYNELGKEQGKVKFYYPNGQVEFEYAAENGVASGKAFRYYENGDIKEAIEYNSDGTVAKSEPKDMVNPPITVKDPGASVEGAPIISNPIVKGGKFQPNGYNKVYNTEDEIWQDGDFKGSRLYNGKVYVYDRDGILLKVKVYKNGVYHSDGQL